MKIKALIKYFETKFPSIRVETKKVKGISEIYANVRFNHKIKKFVIKFELPYKYSEMEFVVTFAHELGHIINGKRKGHVGLSETEAWKTGWELIPSELKDLLRFPFIIDIASSLNSYKVKHQNIEPLIKYVLES